MVCQISDEYGRSDEAVSELRRAQQLDPLSSTASTFAREYCEGEINDGTPIEAGTRKSRDLRLSQTLANPAFQKAEDGDLIFSRPFAPCLAESVASPLVYLRTIALRRFRVTGSRQCRVCVFQIII
jgi:hypothetical protein